MANVTLIRNDSRRSISPWILAAAIIGGAYGLRRFLAHVGKRRIMKYAYEDLTPYQKAKYLRRLRKTSHPWISRAFEKVYIRSR